MKRTAKRILVTAVCLALCVSLIACGAKTSEPPVEEVPPAPREAQEAAGAYDGSYIGTAKGFGGDVVVTLTVENNKVTNCSAEGANETEGIGLAAIESLNGGSLTAFVGQEPTAINAESVDAVTGATTTSAAVKNALKQAVAAMLGETVEAGALSDMEKTYTVYGNNFSLPFEVGVKIANQQITDISIVNPGGETPSILQTVIDRYIPRVLEAQSLSVDAISGATASSNAVRSAVAMAIDDAGGNSADWYTPIQKSGETKVLDDYDVVVVGLGSSGLSAYMSAASEGAKVFGVETAGKIGGTSTHVGGLMSVNPTNEAVRPSEADKTDKQYLFDTWMRDANNDAKPEVVQMLIDESGETLDWLVEDWDFAFGPVGPFFGEFLIYSSYMGNLEMMYNNAIEKAKKLNDKNDYMLELTAKELLINADGSMAGVRAEYYDGTIYEIHAPAVVLATGGYGGSAELTQKYLGFPLSLYGMYQNDGKGIEMAQNAGGALYNISVPAMQHAARTPVTARADNITVSDGKALHVMVSSNDVMAVNSDGERFVNEALGMGISEYSWKAGKYFYTLFSQADIERIKAEGFPNLNIMLNVQDFTLDMMAIATGNLGNVDMDVVLMPGAPIPNMDAVLEAGIAQEIVFKGNTLEELAQTMGMSGLVNAVEQYNSYAKGGQADPLGKDPMFMREISAEGPYYLVKGEGFPYTSCGGLDVDVNANVLSASGSPIKGLYAVGTDSLGVLLSEDASYFDYGGVAHGWCFVSGKIAGAHAASLNN